MSYDKTWQRKNVPTLMVLYACWMWRREGAPSPVARLKVLTVGAPEKVIYSALFRDYDNDLLEYGVSITYAWPTEKGDEWLRNNWQTKEQQ